MEVSGFLKQGYPANHPFLDWIFPYFPHINYPFGGTPLYRKLQDVSPRSPRTVFTLVSLGSQQVVEVPKLSKVKGYE